MTKIDHVVYQPVKDRAHASTELDTHTVIRRLMEFGKAKNGVDKSVDDPVDVKSVVLSDRAAIENFAGTLREEARRNQRTAIQQEVDDVEELWRERLDLAIEALLYIGTELEKRAMTKDRDDPIEQLQRIAYAVADTVNHGSTGATNLRTSLVNARLRSPLKAAAQAGAIRDLLLSLADRLYPIHDDLLAGVSAAAEPPRDRLGR
ncbi:hypothetical protein [Phycicoccus sp.]|uniref:hypothetical protein n=1 Tax=Phycicoccus sp. TaxID=1902410 RepID=UPI002BF6696E|nr:hypothetical protein [Phycicoccus sp.]HMM95328.1 hypothetical protein [Phycicoccus sp.]